MLDSVCRCVNLCYRFKHKNKHPYNIRNNCNMYKHIYIDNSNSTTKIVITQTLEKQSFLWTWKTVGGTRTKTVNGSTATLTGKVSGLESGTYRVKTVFKVTADGETETITVYSAEKEI